MMTSRAEYRLLLRQDNADIRLRRIGYEAGLISDEQINALNDKEEQIRTEIERLKNTYVGPSKELEEIFNSVGSEPITNGMSMADLIKRPELDYDILALIDPERPELREDIRFQVNVQIKYDGYIARQLKQVEAFKKLEKRLIPEDFDYKSVYGLRIEAVQKLDKYRPVSIGQAGRISGVSPADISVLLIALEQHLKNQQN